MKISKFGADFCNPCKVLDKTLKEVAKKYPDIEINIHDIEEEEDLASEKGIRSVPVMIFSDDNWNELERTIGAIPISKIEEIINKYR